MFQLLTDWFALTIGKSGRCDIVIKIIHCSKLSTIAVILP